MKRYRGVSGNGKGKDDLQQRSICVDCEKPLFSLKAGRAESLHANSRESYLPHARVLPLLDYLCSRIKWVVSKENVLLRWGSEKEKL